MIFKFYCTCGQKVSATDDMIGTAAQCPRCAQKVIVPRPEDVVEPGAMPHPPAPAMQPAPPPALPPRPPAPAPAAAAPTSVAPLSVVPRPMGLLSVTATVALAAMLGATAFVFRGQLANLSKASLPILLGTPVALLVYSLIAAFFLRLAVKIVARLNLALAEAWLVTLTATALIVLSMAPVALIQLHMIPVETGAKLLPLTGGLSLLLTIAAYSFLIRNAQGRPIGIGRGILAYLIQGVLVGLIAGLVLGAVIVIWHPWTSMPKA